MLFEGLLDPLVCVRESELSGLPPTLFPEEAALVANAVDRRRREFAAGRSSARMAMAALGHPPVAILAGTDRAPIWPKGLVGSISHSSTWCVAAVALQSDGVRSIGVDIEELEPMDGSLAAEICVESEQQWLDRQPVQARGLLLKAIFSAKECAYKCQYLITKTFLGYDAMRIDLNLDAGLFSAVFQVDTIDFLAGSRLEGRIRLASGHIATGMVLR